MSNAARVVISIVAVMVTFDLTLHIVGLVYLKYGKRFILWKSWWHHGVFWTAYWATALLLLLAALALVR